MKRRAVSSSSLRSIGYQPRTSTLEVEFVNGGIYRYHGVPWEVVEALREAESLGAFFNENIRDRYETVKVM